VRRFLANSNGLTLMELLVVSAVLSTIGLMVHETTRVQSGAFRRESARTVTQGELRVWLGRMVSDIRQAGYDPTDSNAFGFTAIDSDEIRFTADVNRDGIVDSGASESFGYRLNGDSLERWYGGTSWRTVVSGLQSLQLVYKDSNGNAVTSARDVAMVEIVLAAHTETGGLPTLGAPVVTRSAAAEIRNDLY